MNGLVMLLFVLSAIDLCKKMMTVDVNKRISMAEVFNHPWLKVCTLHNPHTIVCRRCTPLECLAQDFFERGMGTPYIEIVMHDDDDDDLLQ